jgi:hypothetical protein
MDGEESLVARGRIVESLCAFWVGRRQPGGVTWPYCGVSGHYPVFEFCPVRR